MIETGSGNLVQALARRDRAVVLSARARRTALAWAYTAAMALHGMESRMPWSVRDAVFMLLMWFVMMVAMMLPSASPMLLMFVRIGQARATSSWIGSSGAFLAGYLALWLAFSVFATAAQAGLHAAAVLSPEMTSVSSGVSGVALVAAGIYQFSAWKNACLAKCRMPFAFLMSEWRNGSLGAFVMGLRHGIFCVGCCWLVMLLLFVAGVMNLAWIAVLTILVLAEKVLPHGAPIGRVLGIVAIGWGAWLLFAA